MLTKKKGEELRKGKREMTGTVISLFHFKLNAKILLLLDHLKMNTIWVNILNSAEQDHMAYRKKYKNLPMQYTKIVENFSLEFLIFFLLLLKTLIVGIIGLTEAVLISIHRLCFRVKIRKIKSIHLYTPSF